MVMGHSLRFGCTHQVHISPIIAMIMMVMFLLYFMVVLFIMDGGRVLINFIYNVFINFIFF